MVKILSLEINEICPDLIESFIKSDDMPNMKFLLEKSHKLTTIADADPPALEPWIQWYSAHTGLKYEEHNVFRLTQGARANHKNIWELLKENGLKVMNFGSMNAKPINGEEHLYLPDPWNKQKTNPKELQIFSDFITKNIQEYTNDKNIFGSKEIISFLIFMLSHGLSLRTCVNITSQLTKEVINPNNKLNRVFILDDMMLDVFTYYMNKRKPDFSSFFSNSIAHIQHAYWRYFEPEKFIDVEYCPVKSSAIKNAYIKTDILIGNIMKLANKLDMKIIFSSALSQQPYTKEEQAGGRIYYRPKNVNSLLEKLDIKPSSIEAVMTHQFILYFSSSKELDYAESKISSILYGDNNNLFTVIRSEDNLIFDCKIRRETTEDIIFSINDTEYKFFDIFYKIEDKKSGCHNKEGILLLQKGLPYIPTEDNISVEKIFNITSENLII